MCKKQQNLPIIKEIDQDLRFLHNPPPPILPNAENEDPPQNHLETTQNCL